MDRKIVMNREWGSRGKFKKNNYSDEIHGSNVNVASGLFLNGVSSAFQKPNKNKWRKIRK